MNCKPQIGETFFHPFTLFCRLFCPPRSLLLFLSVPFFSFFIAFFSSLQLFYPLSPPSSLFSTNPARESGKCGRLPHQGLGAAPAASMLLCMSSPKNCNLGQYFGCLFSPGIQSSLFTSPRTCETAPPFFLGGGRRSHAHPSV